MPVNCEVLYGRYCDYFRIMKRWMSLSHLSVIELSPPEAVSVAHAAGFDCVDLRLAKAIPSDTEYPVFGQTPMLRETLARLRDTGVRVFDIELIRLKRDTDPGSFERLFDTAQRLGARRIKVAGDDKDLAVITERFAQVCAMAARYGLQVDLEFMPWSGISSVASAVSVVTAAAQPNGQVLIDALHLSRSGGHPSDLAAFDRRAFGYLQLCDAPAMLPPDLDAILHEARTERLIPGDGGLPLLELLAVFPADTPVSIELPMKALAARLPALERARLFARGTRDLLARASARASARAASLPKESAT